MDFLGYLTIYARIDTTDSEPSYVKFHGDFRKPPTKKFFALYEKQVRKAMTDIGLSVTNITFVTEKEYSEKAPKNVYTYAWDEREEK